MEWDRTLERKVKKVYRSTKLGWVGAPLVVVVLCVVAFWAISVPYKVIDDQTRNVKFCIKQPFFQAEERVPCNTVPNARELSYSRYLETQPD